MNYSVGAVCSNTQQCDTGLVCAYSPPTPDTLRCLVPIDGTCTQKGEPLKLTRTCSTVDSIRRYWRGMRAPRECHALGLAAATGGVLSFRPA